MTPSYEGRLVMKRICYQNGLTLKKKNTRSRIQKHRCMKACISFSFKSWPYKLYHLYLYLLHSNYRLRDYRVNEKAVKILKGH